MVKSTLGLSSQNPSAVMAASRVVSGDKKQRRTSLPLSTRLNQAMHKDEIERVKRNQLTILDKLRRRHCSNKLVQLLRFWPVQGILLLATVWAIFAQDVLQGWISYEWDLFFLIITCLITTLFIAEISIQSVLQRNYFLGFYFWLDLAGTMALIPDIISLSDTIQAGNDVDNSVFNLAKAGRVARTAGALRAGRIARILRSLRLIRVLKFIKVFRRFHNKRMAPLYRKKDDSMSVVGMAHADLVSKRVVVGVMLLLGIVPLLEIETVDNSFSYGLSTLHSLSLQTDLFTNDAFNTTLELFSSQHMSTLLLNVTGVIYSHQLDIIDIRRNTEMEFLNTEDDLTFAIVDIKAEVVEKSFLNILLTTFILLIFAVGSSVFNQDAHRMIIEPLDKTVRLLKSLATQVFALNIASNKEMEMDYVDNIVTQMASTFNICPEEDMGLETDIDLIRTPMSRISSIKNMKTDRPENIPELSDLDSLLSNKDASSYFRLFLTKELNNELLSFWEEVQKFKMNISEHSDKIYDSFITSGSPAQVNISAVQRKKVEEHRTNPSLSTFDIAEAEIFKVMNTDPYPRFKKSELCTAYIKSKMISAISAEGTSEAYSKEVRGPAEPKE